MPRIWDIHVHFPRNFEKPEQDPQEALDHLAKCLQETGVVKASLLCPTTPRSGTGGASFPGPKLTHEDCLEMAQRYPDLFVPHAVVDPEVTTDRRIHTLHGLGYRGLKMIGVRREPTTPRITFRSIALLKS